MKRRYMLGGVAIALALALAPIEAQQPPGMPGGQGQPGGRRGGAPGPAGMAGMFGAAGNIQKLADNLYLIPGGGGNTTVFVTSQGVVLVDVKVSGQGQAILDQVKKVTDKPVTYIINTHSHFDHTGSNSFFPESVTIVAQENLAKALEKDPAFQSPEGKRGLVDKTYKDHLTLFSGDDQIDLYHFGPAHTDGDSLVVFKKPRAMAAGDVFPGKSQPIVTGSGVNYPEFIAQAVKTIKNVDIVIPGHSAPLTWQDFVNFGEFTQLYLDFARKSLKEGKTPVEAVEAFKAQLPAKFKDYTGIGQGMMTGPGGNFEVIYRELQGGAAAAPR